MVSDTTDSAGAYRFLTKDVPAGEYTVTGRHITNGTRAFTSNVMIASDTDTVAVEPLTLKKTGSIKIAVPAEAWEFYMRF